MHNNNNYQCKMCWNKALTYGVGSIKLSFRTIVFTQYMQRSEAPHLLRRGGIAPPPHTFLARDDNFLSTAMPLHTKFTGQMEISNCLPPTFFLVPATPLKMFSLTLGAHACSEGYCSCPVCVYVCVCVSALICRLTHWNHKREIPTDSSAI